MENQETNTPRRPASLLLVAAGVAVAAATAFSAEKVPSFAEFDTRAKAGERLSVVAARVAAARDRLVAAHPNKRLVLVGHSGSLRLLVCALLGLPAAEYWRFNIDPGSLSQVNLYPGGAILVRLNDICHLGDGVEDEGDGDAESE